MPTSTVVPGAATSPGLAMRTRGRRRWPPLSAARTVGLVSQATKARSDSGLLLLSVQYKPRSFWVGVVGVDFARLVPWDDRHQPPSLRFSGIELRFNLRCRLVLNFGLPQRCHRHNLVRHRDTVEPRPPQAIIVLPANFVFRTRLVCRAVSGLLTNTCCPFQRVAWPSIQTLPSRLELAMRTVTSASESD